MRAVSQRSARRRFSLACLLMGLSTTAPASAADRTWISSTSRFFHDTGAWSGAVVPGSGDNARFNLDATYSVLFITSPVNQLATFSNGTVSFDLGNQTYTLSSTTSSLVVGTTNLFSTVAAHLNITSEGGTLQTQSTSIGNVRGPGTVSVGSAAWNSTGTLTVGSGGVGSVIISAGGMMNAATVLFGSGAGIAGTGSVSGSGATLNSSSRFEVGDAGNGTLLIGSGGVVDCTSASQSAAVADQTGSHGYVGISGGGRWTTFNDILVGDGGDGTIVIDGGSLSSSTGSLYVGPQGGASGYVSLINAGVMGFLGDAIIDNGSISIGGGIASFRGVNIGALNGATGTLAISGGNTLAHSNIYVGGGSSGSISNGVLSVSAGSFGTTGLLKKWPTGMIHLSGGLLSAATLDLNAGSFDWTGGTLQVTRDLIIGAGGAKSAMTIPSGGELYSLGTLTVSGSLSSTGGNLYAGEGIHLISGGAVTLDDCVGQTGAFVDSIGGTFILRGGSYANTGGDSEVVSGGLLQIEQAGNWSDPPNGGNHFSVAPGATLSIASGGSLSASLVAISGVGTITDSGSKLTAELLSITGTLTASGSAAISTGSISVPSGGSLTIGPGCNLSTQSMSFSGGSATLGIDPDPTNVGTLAITSNDPVSRIAFSSKAHVGTLTLTSGRGQATAGGNSILVLRNLTVNTANGAALDLTNNKAILEYSVTTALPTIRSLIISGRNAGTWTGPGITSTSAATTNGATAIGYAEAFALFNSFPNTFAGESIDSTSILMRYTYTGDANLDGTVNSLDFTRLAASFNSTTGLWSDGDFNYDGKINALDFNALAVNFGQVLPAPALGTLIPEPNSFALASAVLGLARRRRRCGATVPP